MEDGIYSIRTYNSDIEYRVEVLNGVYYWADGSGWREKLEFPEEVVSFKRIEEAVKID